MRPCCLKAAVLSLPALAACSGGRDRFADPQPWFPPPVLTAEAPPVSFEQPFFIPPGEATAVASAPVPSGPAPAPEIVPCLTEASGGPQCVVALRKIGQTGAGKEHTWEVYQRACEAGEKLLGCKIFLSTAITDTDMPNIERLMLCEHGAYEACEGMKPKAAPLVAWLQTAKQLGCKDGANALCPDFHQCKAPARWTCNPPKGPAGSKVCGCLAKCAGTVMTRHVTGKKWPDGTQRGELECASGDLKPIPIPF